ncbi:MULTISPECIES: sensor histidine kinase [Clostridium]|uniref:sensor histidine kinase n=1 Tax=Clostridium TaxID=1485 RepID=UPI00082577B3|nr:MULTISPECIES: HAMP domain-containing sensor histidine kinase [Clostridium]PJI08029.1 sensor histidine kinase [Clostridium sp. CT7]
MNSLNVKELETNYNKDKFFRNLFFILAFGLYVVLQVVFLNYKFSIEVNEVFKALFNMFVLFSAVITYKILHKTYIFYIIIACSTITCIDIICLTSIIKYIAVSDEFLNLIVNINSATDCITYAYIYGTFIVLGRKKANINIKITYSIFFASIGIVVAFIMCMARFNVNFKYLPIVTCVIITLIFLYTLFLKGQYIKKKNLVKEYIFLYLIIMMANIFCINRALVFFSLFMELISSILIYIMVSEKIFYKSLRKVFYDTKQNINKIKLEKESYKNVLEKFKDGIIIQEQNKIIFMNKVQRNMFDLSANEIVKDKGISDFIHKGYSDDKKDTDGKVTTVKGKELYLEVNKFDILVDGKKLVLNVVKDISNIKHAEKIETEIVKMRENDKAKGEFFANISHELRTPINVIYSALQVMQIRIDKIDFGKQIDEKAGIDKYIKILKQNCYRLLRIISNLIDITKIDTGFLKPCVSNREIISLVENISMSIVPYLHQKGMELIFDTDVEEKYVKCDPDMIERIMLNLLSNAVKFRRENGEVLINMHDKGSKIVLEVEDNGIGIPKEKQNIIFKRFKQVNPSRTSSCQGSGIGLSLVKSIVEMNNGKISVESKENVGTKFTIEFPAIQNEIMKEYVNVKKVDDNNIKNIVEKVNIEFADIYID